ncbi:hypothetical protein J31TS4_24420 [Paenibacillus sp. J31TS4]|uniref:CidA/LrgA family protein n=1 Tax=Paenibacillus sp. J31TS4 TaxID=2807195 RepID=UPI001B0A9795|nr:CidA/LrgA family protein [Paenibacillus sp. J31TS4]GIP39162.1 hypothetical protein J31TS4_24420 [Paenibacillus sp. J31TS4]
MRTIGRIAGQCLLLLALNAAGTGIVRLLHWRVSGSMVGIVLTLILLGTGLLKLKHIEQGADWMLGTMLLFFIPSAVGIVQYGDLLMSDGWRLLAMIGLGTLVVMAGSGLLTDYMIRKRRGTEWEAEQHGSD